MVVLSTDPRTGRSFISLRVSMNFFKRDAFLLWLTIVVFSFGLCILGGQLAYWIWNDVLLAQVVGLVLGIVGIIAAYKIWERE